MENTAKIWVGRKRASCTALSAGTWAAWPRDSPFRATPDRSIPCGTRVLRLAEPKEPRARAPEAQQPLTAPSPAWDPGCSQRERMLLPAFPRRRTPKHPACQRQKSSRSHNGKILQFSLNLAIDSTGRICSQNVGGTWFPLRALALLTLRNGFWGDFSRSSIG